MGRSRASGVPKGEEHQTSDAMTRWPLPGGREGRMRAQSGKSTRWSVMFNGWGIIPLSGGPS